MLRLFSPNILLNFNCVAIKHDNFKYVVNFLFIAFNVNLTDKNVLKCSEKNI